MRELQVHLALALHAAGLRDDSGGLLDDVGFDAWLPAFVDADLKLQLPTVAQRTSQNVSVVDEFRAMWETEPSAIDQTRRVVERPRSE